MYKKLNISKIFFEIVEKYTKEVFRNKHRDYDE